MKTAVLGKARNRIFSMPFEGLKKHFIALGSSGSGKTVLCKAVIEEAVLNSIPAILVDTQGDLSSLAVSAKNNTEFDKKQRVVIYTPTSSKGIPLCVNPLKITADDMEGLISIVNQVSVSITKLLGYRLESDKGKGAQTAIYNILMQAHKSKEELKSFQSLADKLSNESQRKELSEFLNENELKTLIKKIKFLTVGEKELLFQYGVPLDIDAFFSKSQISIIYLNTLENDADKDFFVSMLATSIYQWMLKNPSPELQALFYIDEIGQYLPAGAIKPLSKPILTLLYKQARKYGLGCIVSTQNPGDIDYRAFSQFSTWAIGRLTTKQDREKIKEALKSLAGKKIEELIEKLPKLKPGEFLVFSPDYFEDIVDLKVRLLYTQHKTLNEKEIQQISDRIRKDFEQKILKVKKTIIEQKTEMHIRVNIGLERMSEIAKGLKRKRFFIGKAVEEVESIGLVFEPLLMTKIRAVRKKFLKKEIREYDVVFDGNAGEPLVFRGTRFKRFQGAGSLLGLNDSQSNALRALLQKKQATAAEICLAIKTSQSAANKILHELHRKNLAGYIQKANLFRWYPLVKIELPKKIQDIATEHIELTSQKIEDVKIESPRVDLKELAAVIRSWFRAELASVQYIYYPVYKIRLSGRKRTREIRISAVTGKVL
jgi:predicted transcriptional regulator